MTALHRTLRRVALTGALAAMLSILLGLLSASPAAAHAELVSSNPANGARLDGPPPTVRLSFTESVHLIPGGIRLIGPHGRTIATPDPAGVGHTVTLPMPGNLADGAYTVSWRVVSSDGHPVAGALSFGVGADADPAVVAAQSRSEVTAPWPVVTARWTGYLTFSLLAGVFGFLLWCTPGSPPAPVLQVLTRCALVGGMAAALMTVLLQGPYTAGVSASNLVNPWLLRDTLTTPFGSAMLLRLTLYIALSVLAWQLPGLMSQPLRWIVPAGLVALATTIAAAGHGAATGPLDLVVVTTHVLAAGVWVGGLVVLVALGASVEHRAWHRFSTLAMTSVLAVVVTGVLNSLRHVHAVDQLFVTRYGLLLLAKLTLVGAVVVAAAISRHRVGARRSPLRSVRTEAVITVGVLAITAMLSMTTPPPRDSTPANAATSAGRPTPVNAAVQMSLRQGRQAGLAVLPAGTTGSRLHLFLTDRAGRPLRVTRVELKVTNPGRGVANLPVPLTRRKALWVADYRFPFPGRWKAILTVEDTSGTAVLTTGDFTVVG